MPVSMFPPVDIAKLKVYDCLNDLASGSEDGRLPVRVGAKRSDNTPVEFEENYFVINNGLLISSGYTCVAVSSDGYFFPKSFCKNWPYFGFLSKENDNICVDLGSMKTGKHDITVFTPFTNWDMQHLYHTWMDNYGRISWFMDLDRSVEIAVPWHSPLNNTASRIYDAFTKGLSVLQLSEGVHKFRRIIIPPPGNRDDIMFTSVVNYVSKSLIDEFKLRGHFNYYNRLYVSRSDTRVRNLINEAQLVSELRSRGFVAICPGNFSLQAQLEIFSSAEIVIGIHGMGLAPIIVSRNCRKLYEFEAVFDVTPYGGMAANMGVPYQMVRCEQLPDENRGTYHWLGKANIREFLELLDREFPLFNS